MAADQIRISDLRGREPKELVPLALEGRADAFEELHRQFWPRLVNIIRTRMGQHAADAEDVAQETMARAFRQLHRFDSRFRFSTWLYTIALRLARDHARSHDRRPGLLDAEVAAGLVCHSVGPASEEQSQQLSQLWQLAARALSRVQYQALWLRYREGLSVSEIATVLGKTQIATRVTLHRARLKLLARTNGPAGSGDFS